MLGVTLSSLDFMNLFWTCISHTVALLVWVFLCLFCFFNYVFILILRSTSVVVLCNNVVRCIYFAYTLFKHISPFFPPTLCRTVVILKDLFSVFSHIIRLLRLVLYTETEDALALKNIRILNS